MQDENAASQTTVTEESVYSAAEAIRAEMRTFRVEWFVEDATNEGGYDLTPYNCLAVAALRAAGVVLPEGF
jgi:hypothetical protein